MNAKKRATLIEMVEAGYAVPAAAMRAGVTMRQVRAGGRKLEQELADAEKVGTASLEAIATERGLAGDNALLRQALERRGGGADTPEGLAARLGRLSGTQVAEMVQHMPSEAFDRLSVAVHANGDGSDLVEQMNPVEREQMLLHIEQELEESSPGLRARRMLALIERARTEGKISDEERDLLRQAWEGLYSPEEIEERLDPKPPGIVPPPLDIPPPEKTGDPLKDALRDPEAFEEGGRLQLRADQEGHG